MQRKTSNTQTENNNTTTEDNDNFFHPSMLVDSPREKERRSRVRDAEARALCSEIETTAQVNRIKQLAELGIPPLMTYAHDTTIAFAKQGIPFPSLIQPPQPPIPPFFGAHHAATFFQPSASTSAAATAGASTSATPNNSRASSTNTDIELPPLQITTPASRDTVTLQSHFISDESDDDNEVGAEHSTGLRSPRRN